MEKCVTWYELSLKQNMKKPAAWVLIAIMLFLLWVVSAIRLPDGTNTTVAICYNESDYSDEVVKRLNNSDSEFEFVSCEDEEEVYAAVENGSAECGFVFCERFDRRIEQGEWENTITCYTTPFGTKTDVAKENLYAALFPIYGRWLLTETEDEIYQFADESRLEELLRQNESYLSDTLILTFEEIRIEDNAADEKDKIQSTIYSRETMLYPLQGLVELFVLLSMLLAAGTYGQKETAQIESALLIKDKVKFRYINLLANGTSMALTGLVVILFSSYSRGVGVEIVWMLTLVLIGAFGVLVFSKLFKNRLTFLSWVTTFVLCFLLLRFGVAGYVTH